MAADTSEIDAALAELSERLAVAVAPLGRYLDAVVQVASDFASSVVLDLVQQAVRTQGSRAADLGLDGIAKLKADTAAAAADAAEQASARIEKLRLPGADWGHPRRSELDRAGMVLRASGRDGSPLPGGVIDAVVRPVEKALGVLRAHGFEAPYNWSPGRTTPIDAAWRIYADAARKVLDIGYEVDSLRAQREAAVAQDLWDRA